MGYESAGRSVRVVPFSDQQEGHPLTDVLTTVSTSTTEGGAVRTRVVLDTSVLVADPSCLHGVGDVDVVIPLVVIEELDGLKTRLDDVSTALSALEVEDLVTLRDVASALQRNEMVKRIADALTCQPGMDLNLFDYMREIATNTQGSP